MYEFFNIVIVEVIVVLAIFGAIIYYAIKEKKRIEKEIIDINEKCTPRRGIIVDVMIEINGNDRFDFYPIIKDVINNKLYLSYGKYNYTIMTNYYQHGPGYIDYELKTKGKKLKIGDTVNLYIRQEIENLQSIYGKIHMNNICYTYMGKKENMTDWLFHFVDYHKVVNEVNDNFINEANNIIVYEGYIEPNVYE